MSEEDEGVDKQELMRERLLQLQKMQEAEAQLRSILRAALEPEAYERLMNVRISNPELYMQIARLIVTLYRNKQLPNKISEKQLRELLARVTKRHEGKFEIKRK
ncbi:hypothetical protein DRN67_04575 [Candidatus Micrarchaeota archaeon]|nr:MAG: hypothetical protein DRN67_04575 [Candidatus Micrarchaeota archaeon]